MRSLYVDDIPGAKPTKRVYQKKTYREKHNEEIYRFARNPQDKRVIDWYVAPKKMTQPLDREDDANWATKRSLRKSSDNELGNLSKSLILPRASLSNSSDSPLSGSQSVLRSSARNSLNYADKVSNPYFPHMYVDPKMGESNKWSGTKVWQEEPTRVIQLPTIQQCYFKKWF